MPEEAPQSAVELAHIRISVLMGEGGRMGVGYNVDGLEPEAALGYLLTIADQLRAEISDKWAAAECEDGECPHCGAELEEYDDD